MCELRNSLEILHHVCHENVIPLDLWLHEDEASAVDIIPNAKIKTIKIPKNVKLFILFSLI